MYADGRVAVSSGHELGSQNSDLQCCFALSALNYPSSPSYGAAWEGGVWWAGAGGGRLGCLLLCAFSGSLPQPEPDVMPQPCCAFRYLLMANGRAPSLLGSPWKQKRVVFRQLSFLRVLRSLHKRAVSECQSSPVSPLALWRRRDRVSWYLSIPSAVVPYSQCSKVWSLTF